MRIGSLVVFEAGRRAIGRKTPGWYLALAKSLSPSSFSFILIILALAARIKILQSGSLSNRTLSPHSLVGQKVQGAVSWALEVSLFLAYRWPYVSESSCGLSLVLSQKGRREEHRV